MADALGRSAGHFRRHPQHLYLGYLVAQSLAGSGTICVYDTAFQAGYLKTPIFNGSRIAEIILFVGGGTYNPAAYKVGLLVLCLLVPVLLLFACFGCGLSGSASLLATATGIFLAWGPSGRLAIEAGETDVLLAALAMLAHAAMLIRYHRAPGFLAWLGVWLTAGMVWFCQPLMFPLALPLLLFFYLSVGARHSTFTWHGSLFLAQAAALAVQLPWLVDWVNYWWLRSPLPASTSMLPHRTLQTLWDAPLWGGALDRGLALVVLGSRSGRPGLAPLPAAPGRPSPGAGGGGLIGPRFSGHFLGAHWPDGDLRLVFARPVVCRLAGRPCLDVAVRGGWRDTVPADC